MSIEAVVDSPKASQPSRSTVNGDTVIPFDFICERGIAGPFREGLARLARDDKWGQINREGNFVFEPRFDMAYEFSEGLAVVELNKRKGYVNCCGEIVAEPRFLAAEQFSCGLARFDTGTGPAHASIADACEKASSTNKENLRSLRVSSPQADSSVAFVSSRLAGKSDTSIAPESSSGAAVG
jgi:hypothetical protein